MLIVYDAVRFIPLLRPTRIFPTDFSLNFDEETVAPTRAHFTPLTGVTFNTNR